MSKQLPARIRCPDCAHQFDTTVYRSIWIEYPENRKLIFDDRINVVTCPACDSDLRLPAPLLCANVTKQFAVWYEPYPDADVEKDVQLYAQHHGPRGFYAMAPRIREWTAFKEKIVELEEQSAMKSAEELRPQMWKNVHALFGSVKKAPASHSAASMFTRMMFWLRSFARH